MRLDTFIAARSSDWHELELLLREARRRPGAARAGAAPAARRASTAPAAADLARLRRHAPRAPETARLEALVRQGRQAVYDVRTRRGSIVRFFVTDYWRLIAARRKALLVAFVLLFGSAALARALGRPRPGGCDGRRPAAVPAGAPAGSPVARPVAGASRPPSRPRSSRTTSRSRSWRSPAGSPGGIATALALLYNGLLLGVIGGLMGQAGNGVGFVDLVTAHGVLELSCILVGRRSRAEPRLVDHLPRPAHAPRLAPAGGGPGVAARGRHGAVARDRRDRRGEPRQPRGEPASAR